jgi:hypothetical protein
MRMGRSKSKLVPESYGPSRRLRGPWKVALLQVMIMKAAAVPGQPWMWTLAFGYHEDRTQTHGYAATREAAMTAFAKSWRRG